MKTNKKLNKFGSTKVVLLYVAFILIVLASVSYVLAQQPTKMSLQGKLENATTSELIDSANLTVIIWNSAGSVIYNHSHANAVQDGIFDILLGEEYQLNLTYNADYNLSIYVDGSSTAVGGPYPFRGGQGQIDAGNIVGLSNASYQYGYNGSEWKGWKATPEGVLQMEITAQSVTAADDFTVSGDLTVTGDGNFGGTVYAGAFSSNSPLRLQTSGITRIFVNDTNGNVGIGTTSPLSKLDLAGNFRIAGNITPSAASIWSIGSNNTPFKAAYIDELYISGSSIYMNNEKILESQAAEMKFTATTDQHMTVQTLGSGLLKLWSDNADISLVTTGVGRIFLDSNDDVLIQTDQSNKDISIKAIGSSSDIFLSATGEIDLTSSNVKVNGNMNVSGNMIAGTFIGDGSGLTGLGAAGRWNVTGSDLYPESLSYNVGIGTDSPSHKLNVVGDVNITGDIIQTDFTTLTDNSMADTLHRHSELSASDGSPDKKLVIAADGNMGFGVTPEAWRSVYSAFQIGGNGAIWAETTQGDAKALFLSQNIYRNTGNAYTYISTDEASRLLQVNGGFFFDTAPSGTAGTTATFTNRMAIANTGDVTIANELIVDGNVGIGMAIPLGKFNVEGSSPFQYFKDTSGGADEKLWRIAYLDSDFRIQTRNDANNAGATALLITRSGTTVTSTTLYGDVTINNDLTVAGDVTAPNLPPSYEEGEEDAVVKWGANVAGLATSGDTIYWQKIGNYVTVHGKIHTVSGTATGDFTIDLPFTSATGTFGDPFAVGPALMESMGGGGLTNVGGVVSKIVEGATVMKFYGQTIASSFPITGAMTTNAFVVTFTITYRAA